MPLYHYKCSQCELIVEKFQHSSKKVEVKCEECDAICERLIGFVHSRTKFNARDNMERRINPEVNRIMENVSKGKDKDFLDIAGD